MRAEGVELDGASFRFLVIGPQNRSLARHKQDRLRQLAGFRGKLAHRSGGHRQVEHHDLLPGQSLYNASVATADPREHRFPKRSRPERLIELRWSIGRIENSKQSSGIRGPGREQIPSREITGG